MAKNPNDHNGFVAMYDELRRILLGYDRNHPRDKGTIETIEKEIIKQPLDDSVTSGSSGLIGGQVKGLGDFFTGSPMLLVAVIMLIWLALKD